MTEGGAEGSDARSGRRFWEAWSTVTWWAVGLVGAHLVLGLLLYEPVLYTGGDNAGYMVLGDALRNGAGYRDLFHPEAPLHTKYPPGYPAILAIAGVVGGLQLFKALSLAASALAVGLTYLLGRRLTDPRLGLCAAAVVAVNPLLLQYSHWVLTEAPFTAAVLLALVLHLRRPDGSEPPWGAGLAAATGTFLVRTAGAPVLGAAVATHLTRREWRRAGVALLTTVATVGGWLAYSRAVPGRGGGYVEEFLHVDAAGGGAAGLGLLELVARGGEHLWYYATTGFPWALLGRSLGTADVGLPVTLFGLLLTGFALAGWVVRAREEMGYPEWVAVLYGGLIALWWEDPRFLLPLLPLLVVYALLGVRAAARAAAVPRDRARGVVTAVAAALLVLPGVASAARLAPDRVACVAAYRAGDPCLPGRWRSFYGAARWAGAEVGEGAVFASRKPRIFYWISGHRGEVYPLTPDRAALLRGLDEMGADFVVVDAVSRSTGTFLVPAIRSRLDRFGQVYSEGDPPTTILVYRRARASGAEGRR